MRRVLLGLALVLAIFSSRAAVAQQWTTFAGEWTGNWSNNLGEQGADSLSLAEDAAGNLNGLWTGTVPVSGRQIDAHTISLQGRTATRSYAITGTIVGNQEMTLSYVATRLDDGGGSYRGSARLALTSAAAKSAKWVNSEYDEWIDVGSFQDISTTAYVRGHTEERRLRIFREIRAENNPNAAVAANATQPPDEAFDCANGAMFQFYQGHWIPMGSVNWPVAGKGPHAETIDPQSFAVVCGAR